TTPSGPTWPGSWSTARPTGSTRTTWRWPAPRDQVPAESRRRNGGEGGRGLGRQDLAMPCVVVPTTSRQCTRAWPCGSVAKSTVRATQCGAGLFCRAGRPVASSPDVVSPWGVPSVPFDDLLAAAQKGDAGAFGALYRTFGPLVHRFFRVQQPAEAEDLTSEVFVSVAESLHRFAGDEAAFRGWVFTIAHRRLIDHRRRWARRQS